MLMIPLERRDTSRPNGGILRISLLQRRCGVGGDDCGGGVAVVLCGKFESETMWSCRWVSGRRRILARKSVPGFQWSACLCGFVDCLPLGLLLDTL